MNTGKLMAQLEVSIEAEDALKNLDRITRAINEATLALDNMHKVMKGVSLLELGIEIKQIKRDSRWVRFCKWWSN